MLFSTIDDLVSVALGLQVVGVNSPRYLGKNWERLLTVQHVKAA